MFQRKVVGLNDVCILSCISFQTTDSLKKLLSLILASHKIAVICWTNTKQSCANNA